MELFQDYFSPHTADRYVVHGRIGEGAFGDVKLGRCRRTGRFVAMKYLRIPVNAEGIPKAIFREIESLRQLNSPYVISLVDMFPQETNIVLVLEHAVTDLGALISKAKDHFDKCFIKKVCHMLLLGLNSCHSAGIIHRDIKPSNILITKGGMVKLGDFGLARIYDSSSKDSMSHQVCYISSYSAILYLSL